MDKKQTVKALSHSVFSIHAHLVIVTKYRKKCINSRMLIRLKEIFESLCEDWDCELLEFNGEADHVHLLLSLNPKVQPSKFVNNIKTVSSRRLRSEFSSEISKFLWKDSFGQGRIVLYPAEEVRLKYLSSTFSRKTRLNDFLRSRLSPALPSSSNYGRGPLANSDRLTVAY